MRSTPNTPASSGDESRETTRPPRDLVSELHPRVQAPSVVPAESPPAPARGERWYHEVFEGLPTATILTTLDGVIIDANTAACLLLRRPPRNVLGHPIAAFVHAPYRTDFGALLDRAQETAHVIDFALWMTPSDAAPLDCRVWVRRFATFGHPHAALAWTIASLVPAF
jgi:PAS domain-containing protein